MATYNQFIVTDDGRDLLARVVANKGTFTLSSIKTSSHEYAQSDIATLLVLDDIKQSFPLASADTVDSTTVKLQFNITNVGLDTAYTLATLGVYAKYNESETLFAVSTAEDPDTMAAEQTGALVRNILVTVYIKTDNASSISIAVDMDTYVTKEMLDTAKKELLDMAHPVGSVYMQISGTDPASAFGGTWKKIEGSYLVASGNYGGTTLTAGSQVGETSHLISIPEMPLHKHDGNTDYAGKHRHGTWGEHPKWQPPFGFYDSNGNHIGSNGGVDGDNTIYNTTTDGVHSHHFTTNSTGGNSPMPIMPLATVVNAWYRTA